MPQRVNDETVANLIAGRWEQHEGRVIVKLALDLRDARAEIARLKEELRAANAAIMRLHKELDERPVP